MERAEQIKKKGDDKKSENAAQQNSDNESSSSIWQDLQNLKVFNSDDETNKITDDNSIPTTSSSKLPSFNKDEIGKYRPKSKLFQIIWFLSNLL